MCIRDRATTCLASRRNWICQARWALSWICLLYTSIIGISSVITIISIGNGLKADVMETDEPKSVTVKVDEEETDNLQLITWEDMQAMKDRLSDRVRCV